MFSSLRHLYNSFVYKESTYQAKSEDSIKLFWWNDAVNFGDVINLALVQSLSEKTVEWVPNNYAKDFNMCIGSVLQLANNNATIWGSGYISEKARSVKPPKDVRAVRGPLTQRVLTSPGVMCPEVFGDPALLAPTLFPINAKKKYRLGIIPHFVDKNHPFFQQELPDDVAVIDIETDNVFEFLTQLNECEKIISSSLHGVILGDAYGIPSLRVKFSEKVAGGDFKFNDYFLSVDREIKPNFYITKDMTVSDVLKAEFNYHIDINTSALLSACPFKG